MLENTTYHRIYRLSAWYDLVVTWPFMTPLTLAGMWSVLGDLNGMLGVGPMPELSVFGVLFANFFGSVVVIWSLVRLKLDDARLGRYDALGRALFSAWMINALFNGATPVLYLFLVIEIALAVLQALPVRAARPAV